MGFFAPSYCTCQCWPGIFDPFVCGGIIPGVGRRALKKLRLDENELSFERWRKKAKKAGSRFARPRAPSARGEHAWHPQQGPNCHHLAVFPSTAQPDKKEAFQALGVQLVVRGNSSCGLALAVGRGASLSLTSDRDVLVLLSRANSD